MYDLDDSGSNDNTQLDQTAPDDLAISKWRSYNQAKATEEADTTPDEIAVSKWRKYSTPEEPKAPTQEPAKETAVDQTPQEKHRDEIAYGLGDTPRSIANVVASVAPQEFSDIARSALPTYAKLTGQPQLTPEELASSPPSQDAAGFKDTLKQRNAQFEHDYGQDPDATGNRLIGNFLSAAPAMKAAGAVTPEIEAGAGKISQYLSGAGNAALQAPAVTALSNASSDTPVGTQLAQNSLLGAGIGAAAPVAYDLGTGVSNLVKNAVTSNEDVLTTKAHNALQDLLGGAVKNADLNEYVPGSQPSLAKAAAYAGDDNAGNVAALEKTLSESRVGGENLYNEGFRGQELNNQEARRNYVLGLTGTPDDVTTLQQSRSAEANRLMGNEAKRLADPTLPKGTVWQNTTPADTQKALDYIEAARNGPAAGNSGLMKRLDTMEDLLKDPKSKDPQYIYESVIKPQLTDPIEAINPFDSNNATKSQLPYLKQMKHILDDTVANSASGYKDYLKSYTDMSKQVERQQGLQSLKLVNPEADTSYPTLNKVNNALQKVQSGRQSIDPTDPFKSFTDDDIQKLQNLQKDLEREHSAQNLLAKKGSPTSQNTEFVKKAKSVLGGEKPQWPTMALGSGGAMAGEALGTAFGHPWVLGSPLASALGAGGVRLGNKIADTMVSKHSKIADKVGNLLLSPKEYLSSQQAQSGNFLTGSGQKSQLNDVFNEVVPYGAVGSNRLLVSPYGSKPGDSE